MHTTARETHLPSPQLYPSVHQDSPPQFLHPEGKIHHASSQADADQVQAPQLVHHRIMHVQGNRNHSQCSLWKTPMMPTRTSSDQICCHRFGTHHNKTVIKTVEQEHQVQNAWLSPTCMDQVHILFRMLLPQLPSVHLESLPPYGTGYQTGLHHPGTGLGSFP